MQGNDRSSLKTPPLKNVGGRVIDPVRLQPIDDILMTRDGHELLIPRSHGLGQCRTADLSHRAIDDGSVFVHHGQIGTLSEQPCEGDSKLLARAEYVKWS